MKYCNECELRCCNSCVNSKGINSNDTYVLFTRPIGTGGSVRIPGGNTTGNSGVFQFRFADTSVGAGGNGNITGNSMHTWSSSGEEELPF